MVRTRLKLIKNVLLNGTENGAFDDTISEADLFINAQVKEVYEKEGKF